MKNFMEALQVAAKVPGNNVLETLKFLEIKILSCKLPTLLCQKVMDIIIDYLRTVKPEGELEKMCTMILIALGSQNPGMVIMKLLEGSNKPSLPPRSLLVAVGKLHVCQETATYIGATWKYLLCLLRMAQEEEDMLAMCHMLSGLAISARKHVALNPKSGKGMDITPEEVSVKAYLTLRVLFNHWPLMSKTKVTEQALVVIGHLFFLVPQAKLKNQVNWLTRRLMALLSAKMKPVCVSQCICQLLAALALSGSGGVNLESQLENLTDMLFTLMSEENAESHSLALRAFQILIKLCKDQVLALIRKALECEDPAKIISALQVFQVVFCDVAQTEELKRKVMCSLSPIMQEDHRPVSRKVRMALLSFIKTLAHYDYLCLPEGNDIINYIIKLSTLDPLNEEDIHRMCLQILQMVSLPKLVTLACDPSNIMAFVILSKTATEIALKARTLGHVPYLSSFHLTPTEVISPQKLLTHLVLYSLKPYKQKKFGVRALRLLYALHPITSLHPVINSNLGQLWLKEIPWMLQILDVHEEKSLNQKEWEDRLLQFSSQSLVAINDDNWLEQLTRVIMERIKYFSVEEEEKAFLYRLFGFSLRTSRNPHLVEMMLSSLLNTAHELLQEREGIAMALSIVSWSHLKVVLDGLQTYGAELTDKDTSSIPELMKEYQQREWGLVCDTIYLSYSKIISDCKGVILRHVDSILALILRHYHDCIVDKDDSLRLDFLNALTHLTNSLSNQPITLQHSIPQKLQVVAFMMELIKEEPVSCISSSIRQKAMDIISSFRKLQPLLSSEDRAAVLRTCYKSVLGLPPSDVMLKEASSLSEGQASVALLRETLLSLQRLIEALITEQPTCVPACVELLDTWLNSPKDNERERAMWCTARILSFTVQMNNFEVEIQFPRLGRLVRLLAIRCHDPVGDISFLSAEAVYRLHCVLLQQKQMERRRAGLWEEVGKSEVYSAMVFHNNTYKIAKAFAEYFDQIQVTNLVLTAVEGLTDSNAKVSLAAAQLMNAILKERGRDIMQIEEIVHGILDRLTLQLEPSTKEETLQAMGSLAGSNTGIVVPMLLNKPLPWDRTKLVLWKAFGTQQEATISILRMLISILEKSHAGGETEEMTSQPVAVACALCEMLSGSLCQEAVQEFYPRLLLAILYHLYWVIGQNAFQKMVVYNKEGELGSKRKAFDRTSCALEAVKLVIESVNEEVVSYAKKHHCWDLLSSPKSYYIGIMELTSGIVENCKPPVLHRILSHVRNLLYSVDAHQKVLARAFYVQLLWHRSVAQTLGQDTVGNLVKWIKEPDRIMKEIGLRGISNLALHPGYSEALKSLVPLLRDFLTNEARVTVQAVKGLRNIIYHGCGKDATQIFLSISKQLRPLINDERDEVRISATSALGLMLYRMFKIKPGASIQKEIYAFLVPLLLSLQDNNVEVVKACGGALTEWTNMTGWTTLTQMFQHVTLSDHIQVVEETCKFLVKRSKTQFVGDLLIQSFGFLKSPQSFLREATVKFIESTVQSIHMDDICEDDVQLIGDALQCVMSDPMEPVQSMASTILRQMNENLKSHLSQVSRLSQMSIVKISGRKKHLFKMAKQEGDKKPKKNICSCLDSFRNYLYQWRHRKVKNTPL